VVAVFVDFERAYDKVWRLGLWSKMARQGVSGRMLKWFRAFIHQRTARVRVGNKLSRKFEAVEGLPQGGVASPSMFLEYIDDLPAIIESVDGVHVSLFADDLVIWCAHRDWVKANTQTQVAIDLLDKWAHDWVVSVSTAKTFACTFSLSHLPPQPNLRYRHADIKVDVNPVYLGVTLDRRLTWKPHITKASEKAKSGVRLMKKLAGTQWGSDLNTLKKLYVGAVRPKIEYA
jgi:hypothetical protein